MDFLTFKDFCRKFAAANVSSAPTYKHFPVFNAGLLQVHMMDGYAVMQTIRWKQSECKIGG